METAPAPPPAAPPPPAIPPSATNTTTTPKKVLPMPGSPVEEHVASMVRFNSQPEYFPEYDSLQGSGNWASGESPPPPPDTSPPLPPVRTDTTKLTVPSNDVSAGNDTTTEAIYSTVDRSKKRNPATSAANPNQALYTTTIPLTTNDGTESPALEQSLTPNTMPFSPHDSRQQQQQPVTSNNQFSFTGLVGDTPMLNNGAPLVNIHTATALVNNLENSLNSVNYALFDKSQPVTTSDKPGDFIEMVSFAAAAESTSQSHRQAQQIYTTSTSTGDQTFPTYATIPPRQSTLPETNQNHYSSLDRPVVMDSRIKQYRQDTYNLGDLYRGRIASQRAKTTSNPIYIDDTSGGITIHEQHIYATSGITSIHPGSAVIGEVPYTTSTETPRQDWSRSGDNNVNVISVDGGAGGGGAGGSLQRHSMGRASSRSLQYEPGRATVPRARRDSLSSQQEKAIVRNGSIKRNGHIPQEPQQPPPQQAPPAPPTQQQTQKVRVLDPHSQSLKRCVDTCLILWSIFLNLNQCAKLAKKP